MFQVTLSFQKLVFYAENLWMKSIIHVHVFANILQYIIKASTDIFPLKSSFFALVKIFRYMQTIPDRYVNNGLEYYWGIKWRENLILQRIELIINKRYGNTLHIINTFYKSNRFLISYWLGFWQYLFYLIRCFYYFFTFWQSCCLFCQTDYININKQPLMVFRRKRCNYAKLIIALTSVWRV